MSSSRIRGTRFILASRVLTTGLRYISPALFFVLVCVRVCFVLSSMQLDNATWNLLPVTCSNFYIKARRLLNV
jgi:hypothetical protein